MSGLLKLLLIVGLIAFGVSMCSGSKARDEFVAGCVSSGRAKSVCKCVGEQLFDHYGEKAMVEMQSSNRIPQDFPRVMMHVAADCKQ